jgi:hypothetical protein
MHKFVLATLALTLVPVTFAPSLHAQGVELYGTFTDVHGNNVAQYGSACPVFGPCPYSPTETGVNGLGPGLGMTLNFIRTPGVNLGFDFRGSKHVNTNGADTGLVGLKLSIKPPILHITTYIQGSFGYLGTSVTKASQSADTSHYGAAEILGGVDYPILAHFSIRVLELGVGRALDRLYNSTRPTFVTASSGIVYHF